MRMNPQFPAFVFCNAIETQEKIGTSVSSRANDGLSVPTVGASVGSVAGFLVGVWFGAGTGTEPCDVHLNQFPASVSPESVYVNTARQKC